MKKTSLPVFSKEVKITPDQQPDWWKKTKQPDLRKLSRIKPVQFHGARHKG